MTHAELEALLLAAEEANLRYKFADAERSAREALLHLGENKTSTEEALHIRALLVLSESLWQRGLAKDALPVAEQALERSQAGTEPGIRDFEARALLGIGIVYRDLSEYSKAIDYSKKALAIDDELGNKAGVATMACSIGNVYRNLSQYTESLEYFGVARAIYEELGNKACLAGVLNNIGNVFLDLAQFASALEYYEKALAINEELGNKAWVAINTGNIGIVYSHVPQFAKALEYYEKARAINKELGNKAVEAKNIGNIGVVYRRLSQFEKALEYYEQALAIDEELGNKAGMAVKTLNIGTVHFELSQYTDAYEYFVRAQTIAEAIGDRRHVAYALNHMGGALHKLGRNREAMEYLEQSLKVSAGIKTDDLVADTLVHIGTLLAENHQLHEAIETLEEGLALAVKLGENIFASEAHKELADAYENIGETAKAFGHHKKHFALQKEIFDEDSRKRVEAFNIREAVANKERDLRLARQENEIQQLRADKLQQELSIRANALAQQTELIANFREDLRKILRKIEVKDPAINELRAKLKELPEGVDWRAFDEQFQQVHPQFRAQLEEKFPDLTSQESRICVLLRLNLNSRDISKLIGLSKRTIENHRYNIRGKLGLKPEEDIAKFLGKI